VEPRAKAFAGRAGELGTLDQALAAARAGRGAAILVAGEAGIGKTRLAAELTRRAREAGWQILLGRSIDLVGTELPYQPFAEALRPLGGTRRAVSSQLQVFEETLDLLSSHAAAAPALIVLEDLHWADTSTLDLVVFLAQRARLDLTPPSAEPPAGKRALEETLGLTPREADVLALIARGYTNREIASTLVISVKTAGVHVSHILRKLDAPNRLEAAAIAHRLTPGPGR
jgi:DNA-binding CsgD family transcriptional regulator